MSEIDPHINPKDENPDDGQQGEAELGGAEEDRVAELAAAGQQRDAIEEHVRAEPGASDDDVDAAVGVYVHHAERHLADGSSAEVMAAEAGALQILESPSHSHVTAASLGEMSVESLAPALQALEAGRGHEAASFVMAELDQVAHDMTPPAHDAGRLATEIVNTFASDNQLGSNVLVMPSSSSAAPGAALETVQAIPISPSEQAAQYLERTGGIATPEAIQAIVSRIEAEKDKDGPAKIGPNYAQRVLETIGDDQSAKLDRVESFARADINGSEVLRPETASILLMSLHQETIAGKLTKEESPELMHLADIQSKLPIDFYDPYIIAHRRALRVIVETTGLPATEWIKRVKAGSAEDLPDAAKRYAAMPETPRLALLEVLHRNGDGLIQSLHDKSLPVSERREQQRGFRETFPAVLEVLMAGPEAQRLGTSFMAGDVRKYGFDRQHDPEIGKVSTALNRLGYKTCINYMENVVSLGADEIVALNRDLGTVNFGSYTLGTLQSMRDIITNPGDHPEISIIVRGNDGDPNGAINDLVSGHNLRDTLIFEINTQQGLEKIEATVASLGVKIKKVTLAGHGGASGLHVSSRLTIARDKDKLAENSPLLAIMNRITPDQSGAKNVFLASCSQGRRYDGKGSTAEALASVADADLVVEAASRVAYIGDSGEHGAKVVRTNAYYETARSLKRLKALPGVKSLVAYLDSSDRQRNGTVRVTQKGTTPNPSGIVSIGE